MWKNVAVNGMAASLQNVTLTISVANGTYEVSEWDTWTVGKKPLVKTMTATNGKLTIPVNTLQLDRAYSFVKK